MVVGGPKCVVETCSREAKTRGCCYSHYNRMRLGQIPNQMLPCKTYMERGKIRHDNHTVRVAVPDGMFRPTLPRPILGHRTASEQTLLTFASKVIRLLQVQGAKTEDPKVMAGYPGAIQTVKLMASTIDPKILLSLAQEEAVATRLLQLATKNCGLQPKAQGDKYGLEHSS